MESKETIDPETLEIIATTLKVPVDAIKNFDEESAVNFISNTFNHSGLFLDKFVEVVEKNEKLYEALLKSEREKIALLEKMLQEQKKK